jgi:hypothetical protein
MFVWWNCGQAACVVELVGQAVCVVEVQGKLYLYWSWGHGVCVVKLKTRWDERALVDEREAVGDGGGAVEAQEWQPQLVQQPLQDVQHVRPLAEHQRYVALCLHHGPDQALCQRLICEDNLGKPPPLSVYGLRCRAASMSLPHILSGAQL